jgi:hypothetical protein
MSGAKRPFDEVQPCTPAFPPLPGGLDLTSEQLTRVNAIQLGYAQAVASLMAEALSEIQRIVQQGQR